MMKAKQKFFKFLAMFLIAMILCSIGVSFLAAEPEEQETAGREGFTIGMPEITVNANETSGTVIGFDGQEWYVVGDSKAGLTAEDGDITLLHKLDYSKETDPAYVFYYGTEAEKADWLEWAKSLRYGVASFRQYRFLPPDENGDYSEFRTIDEQRFVLYAPNGKMIYVSGNDGQKRDEVLYFAADSDALESEIGWTNPSDYYGGDLQQKMEYIAEYTMSKRESSLITPRTLTTDDGITGKTATDQKLWQLSNSEAQLIPAAAKNYYSTYFYRTPASHASSPYSVSCRVIQYSYGLTANFDYFNSLYSAHATVVDGELIPNEDLSSPVRPAFNLNLDNVLFATATGGERGKSQTVSGDLADLQNSEALLSDGDAIKFTMKHNEQTLTVSNPTISVINGHGTIQYTDAAIGSNQYISCLIMDENDAVLFYGKLTESSSPSGSIDISLTDELQKKLLNGAYKMYVFSEQDNGTNFTDFAGELIPLTFIEVSSYSISFLPGDHGTLTGETVLTVPEGNTLQDDGGVIPTVTPFCDYTFTYWLGSDNQKYSHEELLRLPIISDMAFTAQYRYIGDSSENEEKYTVIYTDGVSDEEIFPDQVTENLLFGTNTPVFDGEEPKRDGYTFAGWQPSVAATVTGNTTYTAQWKADADHSDNPDTGDNLILSFILPLLSASSLTVLALVKRRKNG